MKTYSSLIALVLGALSPALIAALATDAAPSVDAFLGSYAIAGILCIASMDYTPRRALRVAASAACESKRVSPAPSWTATSVQHGTRARRSLREEKLAA